MSFPKAPSTFNAVAVTALSPTNVWAVGSRKNEQPDSIEAIEPWDATSWNLLTTPSGVGLFAVTALSDGTVVAVGAGSNNSAVILQN